MSVARPARPLVLLTEASIVVAASTLAAIVMWMVDVASWPSVRRPTPLFVSLGLAIATGAGTGVALLGFWTPLRAFARTRWIHVVALLIAVVVAAFAAAQAFASIPGARAHPKSVGLLVAGAGVLGTVILGYGFTRLVPNRAQSSWVPCVALAMLGTVLLALDRTILAPVFEKTYSFVEGAAQLALALALACVARRSARAALVLTACAGIWLGIFVASRALRVAIERTLPAVWEEPVFAARWLRRVRRLDAAHAGGTRTSLQRLREKYDLHHDPGADDPWHVPAPAEGAPPVAKAAAARQAAAAAPRSNVVVFFVDTLRADVAHDPTAMPETLSWMRENQWFSRAYATGSSTLLTLAPMLGCRYDVGPGHDPRLLGEARAAGMKTALFIPKTASDYHRGAFPSFRFEHEDVVPDYDGERIPTANETVDRALAWLRTERPERFFLWTYQFDAHGWSDLDEKYVEGHMADGGFTKSDRIHWRYRAAARGIDQAFTRLRAGLAELGLAETTTVVFVSDHGEALGQQNFWAHSTYLWESLVRVPLAIHVPGAAPHAFDDPVSTVDLAPTLARFVGGTRFDECHGEDLFDRAPERRFPILFSAMIDGEIARIGLLGGPDRKLVVDLRNADARLLRIQDGKSVEEDVSFAEPGDFSAFLRQIAQAPTFPR